QFGGAEALSANAGGADLVVVANLAPVYPYKLYAAKGITTIQGLKGKKVGVSNVGGSSDIATRAALKSAGLDPDKDVNIIAVGSHANRTAALLAGTIDAGVDDPPEVVQFKDAVDILGKGNPNIAKVDISKMIDRTFMQSAQDRKLGG